MAVLIAGSHLRLLIGVTTLVSLPNALAGCGPDPEYAETAVRRFVEQVNADDCDAPSGLELRFEEKWADACHLSVARLGIDEQLDQPEVEVLDSGELSYSYSARQVFVNRDGVLETLTLRSSSTEMRSITSTIGFVIEAPAVLTYGGALDDGPPSGHEAIREIADLLYDGRCSDLATFIPPQDVGLPIDTEACEHISQALTVAAVRPGNLERTDGGYWSAVDPFSVAEGEVLYGVERARGESANAFSERVHEVIRIRNPATGARFDNVPLHIQVIEHNAAWFLVYCRYSHTTFDVDFRR